MLVRNREMTRWGGGREVTKVEYQCVDEIFRGVREKCTCLNGLNIIRYNA